MSPSAAENLAAKRARMAARKTAEVETATTPDVPAEAATDETRPLARSVTAIRSKPVRVTLDLAPELHADLGRWCGDSARDLGLGRVKTVDVLRALIRELFADPALAAKVRARISRDQ